MKTLAAMAGIVVASFGINAGIWTAASTGGPSKQTLEDLDIAMHGEAFAHAKYTLFAKQARQNGREDLAKLFEDAARTEHLEHFAEEAKLAGLVGSDADNLRAAIKGESYEVETMYADFARKAAAVGDKQAAARFEEIRKDEMKHRDAFKAALDKVQKVRMGP
ncbi:MAG TPA: rubrerythrin family protein [Myxococcales bacterium]|jgi:rubrerythrin